MHREDLKGLDWLLIAGSTVIIFILFYHKVKSLILEMKCVFNPFWYRVYSAFHFFGTLNTSFKRLTL